jgi:uncharacterized protein (DUF885 family)
MAWVDTVAEEYVERAAALDPVLATQAGIAGYDHELPDLSADGFAERARLDRLTLAALDAAEVRGPDEQVAREAMRERLGLAVECYDAGDTVSQLNVIASWVQYVREVFDLMPADGEQAAAGIAGRMAAVPRAYQQLSQTLLGAARGGRPPARLQAKPGESFYCGLAQRLTGVSDLMRGELEDAAGKADAATAELGAFLSRELLPLAREKDACGREIYARASRDFLGAAVDLDEAYARGWEEIARLRAEQKRVSDLIQPGATVAEATAVLDRDPALRIQGRENFRAWMQELAERAVSELHGVHFDIPEPARPIEAMIAPASGGGVYYSPPSEDWSRPGRLWWSVPDGMDSFATWKEVTIVYHEGVPGHHLQVSQVRAQRENLNRWQRQLCWVSGHGEGWACYAEQLMDELGYLDTAAARRGMLDMQLLYAVNTVVDIGVHLELRIPEGAWSKGEGERWNRELAWEFLQAHSSLEKERLRFALHRYLGWPGQAPSYQLGGQIWLQARADAKQRAGDTFSLKEFHSKALSLGSMGLDPLRQALARLQAGPA